MLNEVGYLKMEMTLFISKHIESINRAFINPYKKESESLSTILFNRVCS